MQALKEDYNINLVEYFKDRGLVDTLGWKRARIFAKNPYKFILMATSFSSQNKLKINNYKYGVQVPTKYSMDLELKTQN